MSDSNDDKDDDVIIIKPRTLTGIIVLSVMVGAVAGYLICEFSESGEVDDPGNGESVASVQHEVLRPQMFQVG